MRTRLAKTFDHFLVLLDFWLQPGLTIVTSLRIHDGCRLSGTSGDRCNRLFVEMNGLPSGSQFVTVKHRSRTAQPAPQIHTAELSLESV